MESFFQYFDLASGKPVSRSIDRKFPRLVEDIVLAFDEVLPHLRIVLCHGPNGFPAARKILVVISPERSVGPPSYCPFVHDSFCHFFHLSGLRPADSHKISGVSGAATPPSSVPLVAKYYGSSNQIKTGSSSHSLFCAGLS